ncbi:hypothetical protein CEK60_13785 [Halomonas sp. N3-2A]|nr:hypothetical protein CEK60_13785 [Halomonas sp. N3-2A]HBS82876.1 hypothetical protein [Halomonas campaniensis]
MCAIAAYTSILLSILPRAVLLRLSAPIEALTYKRRAQIMFCGRFLMLTGLSVFRVLNKRKPAKNGLPLALEASAHLG